MLMLSEKLSISIARSKLGYSYVFLYALSRKVRGHKIIFKDLWKFTLENQSLFYGRALEKNQFHLDWRNFSFSRIVKIARKFDKRCSPEIRIIGEDIINEVDQHSPAVIVINHSLVVLSMVRALLDRDIPSALIAAHPRSVRRASYLMGIGQDIDLISITEKTLISAMKKMRSGKSIVCCPDHTMRTSLNTGRGNFVDPGIFEFGKRLKAKIIFATTHISDDGEIVISLGELRKSLYGAAAAEMAEDFIAFIRKNVAPDSPLTKSSLTDSMRTLGFG